MELFIGMAVFYCIYWAIFGNPDSGDTEMQKSCWQRERKPQPYRNAHR